ncbi:MAG: hypothetical protein QXP36_00310 [Conexivisphaerales archaeon]|uniref:hypothetical protein n=1 Tax=Saccharolobus sp. TaxID=2100761 RepID=UPI003171195F
MRSNLTNKDIKIINKILSKKKTSMNEILSLVGKYIEEDNTIQFVVKEITNGKVFLTINKPLDMKDPVDVVKEYVNVPVFKKDLAEYCGISIKELESILQDFEVQVVPTKLKGDLLIIYADKSPLYFSVDGRLKITDEYKKALEEKYHISNIDLLLQKFESYVKRKKLQTLNYAKKFEDWLKKHLYSSGKYELARALQHLYSKRGIKLYVSSNALIENIYQTLHTNNIAVQDFIDYLDTVSQNKNFMLNTFYIHSHLPELILKYRKYKSVVPSVYKPSPAYDRTFKFIKDKKEIMVYYHNGEIVKLLVDGNEIPKEEWSKYVGGQNG